MSVMEEGGETGVELRERNIYEDGDDKTTKKHPRISPMIKKDDDFEFEKHNKSRFSRLMKSHWVFFALYIVIFYLFSQFVVIRKTESFLQAIFVVLSVILFVSVVHFKDAPKTSHVLVTIAACLTTNMFVEAAQKVDVIKKTNTITRYCNLFPFVLFLPGALGLRFSPHYLVVMTAVGELYGLTQFYSVLFRGCPFRPVDISALGSAFAIRNEYSLIQPEGLALIALGIGNIVCITRFAFSKNVVPNKKPIVRVFVMLFGGLLLFFYLFKFDQMTEHLINNGVLVVWDLLRLYPGAGGFLAFYIDLRELSQDKIPLGYSPKKAAEILSSFESKETVDKSKLRRPNIIAIQSESLSDYRTFGKFETNQDWMPFIRSLKNNTVRGFVSVTAYGGHSCNSEYEFLTGNSMGFYRYGLTAYFGMVNNRQESLTYVLNDYGYNTIGCSCGAREIWDVEKNYKLLEFNESFFEGDFYGKEELFNKRPTDNSVFNGIMKIYNSRPRNIPLFLYLTSTQNHSPYNKIDNPTVYAKDYKNVYELSTYLTGVKLTDEAVRKLVEHFAQVKEDVVLVLYGDHHPHIPEFTEKALGGPKEQILLEKRVLLQMTPYFIWANYPIKEEQDNIALSFLSSKVMDVAGLPKTAYMNFLQDTKKHVPMMTSFAYQDSNNVWHYRGEKTEASKYLDRYAMIQHYMMNDRKSKH